LSDWIAIAHGAHKFHFHLSATELPTQHRDQLRAALIARYFPRAAAAVRGRQLAALIEIGRRMIKQPAGAAPMLNRPELIAAHMAPYIRGLEVEKFWVLCLNRKNRLKKLVEVTSGTATSALPHPREVFRSAVQHEATAIACVHNHPSGDPAPSSADVQVTRQLREAARALDIELMDHVIIGTAAADPTGLGFYSFRQAGIL